MRFLTTKRVPVALAAVLFALTLTSCGGIEAHQPVATPTANIIDGVPYVTVTDMMFGFRIDIPGRLQAQPVQVPSGLSGHVNQWSNLSAETSNSLQIDLSGFTAGLAANMCPQATPEPTLVAVGPGITGYETDNLNVSGTPPPEGAFSGPGISVAFISNGVVVQMSILGVLPRDTFMQRYGAIWRHMLASFKPGSYVNHNHLCGS